MKNYEIGGHLSPVIVVVRNIFFLNPNNMNKTKYLSYSFINCLVIIIEICNVKYLENKGLKDFNVYRFYNNRLYVI